MAIYIILIICSLLLSFLCGCNFTIKKTRKKVIWQGKNVYLLLMLVVMTLVMSLRSIYVGIDTPEYCRIFNYINAQTSFLSSINNVVISAPLYVSFCRIIGYISRNSYCLITFSSIFINFFLALYIKRTSDNYPLSIFLWFGLALFYYSMNGTRQTMSIVLVLNAIYFLSNDIKSSKGWIYFISAVFIHYSSLFALVGIILIFITKRLKSKISIINFSVIYSSIVALSTSLLRYIIVLFPKYTQYVNGSSYYSILNGKGHGRIILLYLFLGCINIYYILIYLKGKKEATKHSSNCDYNDAILPILIFGTIFGIVNFKNELISRMLLFYLSFYISFIPNIGNGYKLDIKSKHLVKFLFIFIIGIYGILTLIENKNGVVPYSFFWG